MNRLIILYGGISSGKSTLAKSLQEAFGGPEYCTILSSDSIRIELTGSPAGKSKAVWAEMKARLDLIINEIRFSSRPYAVILDATAMSPTYQEIVNDYRKEVDAFVIQLWCSYNSFQEREGYRDDRWKLNENKQKESFVMPDRAYNDSSNINLNPDIKIDTSNLTKEQVFEKAISAMICHDEYYDVHGGLK